MAVAGNGAETEKAVGIQEGNPDPNSMSTSGCKPMLKVIISESEAVEQELSLDAVYTNWYVPAF